LVPPERYVDEVVQLLARLDTDYTRNSDPKQQLISELEPFQAPAILPAVTRFLEDASDDVRFAAVATIFAQQDAASVEALVKSLIAEESMRVKSRIADGLVARGFVVPEALRADTKRSLPPSFTIDGAGKIKRY
ncbi:MAG TPA: HEAT repeat domain-containing protein, partial [Polyangiaceae bacterium]